MSDSSEAPNYFDLLINRRDEQRAERARAQLVIKSDSLPMESNRHGLMQWYLHPAKPDVAVRSELLYVQTIPAGSRSGKQHHPGGVVFYFWKGSGYTILDDVTYRWRAGEVLQLPHRVNGCVYQHFNDGDVDAKIIAAELNMTESLGVDRGSGWEQLEDAPGYTPSSGN